MEVPPKLSGTSPLVPWLNRLREATQSALINSVVNGKYSRGPGGTQLICSPIQSTYPGSTTTSNSGSVERFRILTGGVLGDYLLCETWNGTTGGGVTINIAKPPKLRHSVVTEALAGTTWNYTYSSESGYNDGKRTASDGTNSEKQVVIPLFLIGDEIYATKPTRKTGVTVSSVELEYLDLNVDARAWARKYVQ